MDLFIDTRLKKARALFHLFLDKFIFSWKKVFFCYFWLFYNKDCLLFLKKFYMKCRFLTYPDSWWTWTLWSCYVTLVWWFRSGGEKISQIPKMCKTKVFVPCWNRSRYHFYRIKHPYCEKFYLFIYRDVEKLFFCFWCSLISRLSCKLLLLFTVFNLCRCLDEFWLKQGLQTWLFPSIFCCRRITVCRFI